MLGRQRAERGDHLGDARDAERIGEAQHLLDAVHALARHGAAVKQAALDPIARPHHAGVGAAGDRGEQRRTVATLRRDREVVAIVQADGEREAPAAAMAGPASR